MNSVKFALCILFLAGLSFTCYRHPVPDDFDRYIYEALVRGYSEPIETTYASIKHESPRTESSAVLDSAQHLKQLEPLYAIRPVYVSAISFLSHALPIQSAINLISAASYFGIGLVVLFWTRRPLFTALLMAYYPILLLARFGTPDALSALLVIAALWWMTEQPALAIILLFVSLGVRTDNLLVLLVALAWLAKERRWYLASGISAVAAIAAVELINHWAGNYGWTVLFRYSFIGGRNPAEVPHTLSVSEYLHALASGFMVIFSHVTLWILLGVIAWMRRPDMRLAIVTLAVVLHFFLFPSPEDRYLLWAYILVGAIFIRSFDRREASFGTLSNSKATAA